ncbi:hypothetical protein SAMN02745194_03131 [Roseomonas rosea]|uniref:Phage head-tail joining protein n=1 Tax=Muricoccus roseus TaxID=198092 RepID=A0A1M6LCZ8_9PROT|nr:hypothetical protein [Roseomonas rosea]SHJ69018.1 hypothetical protein SAMN02745194_03131 [Roseomonas rosea]
MPVDIEGLLNGAVRAAFGEPITYRPKAGGELPPGLHGVFDRTQVEALMGEAVALSSVPKTWLGVRQADFPPGFEHRQGDRVLIQGRTFAVVNPLPDGKGWVYLELGSATS